MHSTRALLAREAIAKLAASDVEPNELLYEVALQVQGVVPYEYGGTALLDHETLLPTSRTGTVVNPELSRSLLHNEVVTPDVHKFAELATRPHPVVTRGRLDAASIERSPRHTSILRPRGLGDEVRVVFRAGGSTWGGGCFTRASDATTYDADELRFLAEIAGDVGRGLRANLSRRSDAAARDPSPGVLLIDEQLEVVSATSAARHWRGLIPRESLTAIQTIVLSAQRRPEDERARRARVRLTTGEWLVLHAAPMANPPGQPALTAVTLGPIPRLERIGLLLRLHGLSAREREVTELLLQGTSTDETASQLFISRHTLRDHLKSVFAKVGVASRPELMAVLSGDAPAEAEDRPGRREALAR